MKSKQIIPLLVVAVALAVFVSYWDAIKLFFAKTKGELAEKREGATKEVTNTDGTKTTVQTTTESLYRGCPAGAVNKNKPLQDGTRGPEVWHLQNLLVQMHNQKIVVDGIFGKKTGEALKTVTGVYSISLGGFQKSFTVQEKVAAAVGAMTRYGATQI